MLLAVSPPDPPVRTVQDKIEVSQALHLSKASVKLNLRCTALVTLDWNGDYL